METHPLPPGGAVLAAGAAGPPTGGWLRFGPPRRVVTARRLDEVRPALEETWRRVEEEGLWAVGFVAYEAAPAFDPALAAREPGELPLLCFGLHPPPEEIDPPAPPVDRTFELGAWQPSIDRRRFERAFDAVQGHLVAGDSYQVNLSFRLRASFAGDPWALFRSLPGVLAAPCAAFLNLEPWAVASLSPELFFELSEGRVTARPMKGTAERGRNLAEDWVRGRRLWASPKERAENVMVVDMVRNDLGRVARPGSVAVHRLFDIERYPTVLQMTSTVACDSDASPVEIFAALFPCASITGAPKVRTSKIIAALETTPRGVYTGAVGYLAPGRRARFGVAIRTLTIDRRAGSAEYGVGGGIVRDSRGASEYRECLLKARGATPPAQGEATDFELLETLLWRPGEGFWLLAEHVERLARSAAYFGFRVDAAEVRQRLGELARGLPPRRHRVRLLAGRRGTLSLAAEPLPEEAGPEDEPGAGRPVPVALAAGAVDSSDPSLFHKTTRRQVYERALAAAPPGAEDVLLVNERGEVTESTIANLVVRLGGRLVTPPVACGLLAGTLRARLLFEGEIRERVVTRADLERSEEIFLINSVRGWRRAVVVPD